MKNVSSIQNCYGCGVCAASCGKRIINIRLNEDGFYTPYIDNPDKCTQCGICLDVCAFNHEECALKPSELNVSLGLPGVIMKRFAENAQVEVLVLR